MAEAGAIAENEVASVTVALRMDRSRYDAQVTKLRGDVVGLSSWLSAKNLRVGVRVDRTLYDAQTRRLRGDQTLNNAISNQSLRAFPRLDISKWTVDKQAFRANLAAFKAELRGRRLAVPVRLDRTLYNTQVKRFGSDVAQVSQALPVRQVMIPVRLDRGPFNSDLRHIRADLIGLYTLRLLNPGLQWNKVIRIPC